MYGKVKNILFEFISA